MVNFINKYKFEIIIVIILLMSLGIYIGIKVNNDRSVSDSHMEDGLFPEEKYNSDEEDNVFYSHMKFISETDFNKKQVVSIGQRVRVAGIFAYEPGRTLIGSRDEPNIAITVERVFLADTFCGAEQKNRKYLVAYFKFENLYDGDVIWPLCNLKLKYHKAGENYLRNGENEEDRIATPYGNGSVTNGFYCYNSSEERNILSLPEEKYEFMTQYDDEFSVYIPKNETTELKMVVALDTENQRFLSSENEFTFSYSQSSRYMNGDWVITIPFDKIQHIANVNDGWDDGRFENTGSLYDREKKFAISSFYDWQLKNIGETARCFCDDSIVDVTLKKAALSGQNKQALEIDVWLENKGHRDVLWGNQEGFNIAYFNPDMYVYNSSNVMVDNWKSDVKYIVEGQAVKEIEIAPGKSTDVKLIVPLDYGKMHSSVKKYILGFQLVTPKVEGSSWEYSNKDFAFKIIVS